jgi:hypothetical protein
MFRTRLSAPRGLGLCLAAAGLALVLSSCGERRAAVYPVRGRVLDAAGKPAGGALLIFHPTADTERQAKPVGRVDERGAFSLTTSTAGDGAPPGEYVITLQWPAPRKTPFGPEGKDRLAGRYGDPKKSPLRFTVEEKDDNEVPVIRLR